jgi:Reverse transcriptase (RNA-dependent DNA polymerase)
VISPLLSNVYLTEVDAMLERAKAVARTGAHVYVEYARWADDLVVLVNNDRRQDWLVEAIPRRLREEFAKLDLRVNEEKSRIVDLGRGESFGFLGFDFRRVRSRRGRWRPQYMPQLAKRTAVAAEAQGGVPALRLLLGGTGDRGDQSGPPRVDQLLPDRARESVLWLRAHVGREAGAAPHDAGAESTGLRLDEVEYGLALHHARAVCGLPSAVRGPAGQRSQPIGHITHDAKRPGKPGAGNRHAGFDAAGAGNGPTGTAPVLDPTEDREGARADHPAGGAGAGGRDHPVVSMVTNRKVAPAFSTTPGTLPNPEAPTTITNCQYIAYTK